MEMCCASYMTVILVSNIFLILCMKSLFSGLLRLLPAKEDQKLGQQEDLHPLSHRGRRFRFGSHLAQKLFRLRTAGKIGTMAKTGRPVHQQR